MCFMLGIRMRYDAEMNSGMFDGGQGSFGVPRVQKL